MHDFTEILLRSLYNQMIVICHQNRCVQNQFEFVLRRSNVILEFFVISFGKKDLRALIPSRGNMVEGSFILYP